MKAFVIMPFEEQFDQIYELFISEALDNAGFEFEKADDIKSQQNILKDIIDGISKSDLIIADLSKPNPNVYYELGLAHALNKPVISLTQDISLLPFDLKSYRVIEYDIHFATMKSAKKEFKELLEGFKKREISFSNPITDFIEKEDIVLSNYSANESEQQDLGFIDHLVEIEKYFEELTDLALDLTDSTEKIGNQATKATKKIERAQSDRSSQAIAIRVRKISQSLAEDFDEYSSSLEESNPKYYNINSKIKTSLDFIFNFIDKEGENYDEESLLESKENLTKMEDSLFYASNNFDKFMRTLEDMPEFQSDLKKAIQKTIRQQEKLLDNMDETSSTLSRTVRLIDKILNKQSST